MTTPLITKQQVIDHLKAHYLNSTNINPREACSGPCVNNDGNGNRCIASQVHFDLTGEELPERGSVEYVYRVRQGYTAFNAEARRLLAGLQCVADQRNTKWGDAVRITLTETYVQKAN